MKTFRDFLLFSYQVILFGTALYLGFSLTDGNFIMSLFLLLPFVLVIMVVGNITLFALLTVIDSLRLKRHPEKESWFKS